MSLIERFEQFRQICGLQDDEDTRTPTAVPNGIRDHRYTQDDETEMESTTDQTVTTAVGFSRSLQLVNIVEQPKKLTGGQLKSYQLESLQWLLNMHVYCERYKQYFGGRQNNLYQINPILADEMGLGKTIQTLALLAAVHELFAIKGPHLIIVPKSTLPQWEQEQQKWCPFFNRITVIGEREEREQLLEQMREKNVNIILTTYDMINLEFKSFARMHFQYLIMDEGHKLKSQETQICQNIKKLNTEHKVLLTGTPIQNDLHELWSLLNVLMPFLFDNPQEFVDVLQQEQNVTTLQRILQYFILRREKRDVETLPPKHEYLIKCPMTQLQKRLYKGILMKDSQAMREAVQSKSAEVGRNSLTNVLTQLRKCADHPYLFRGVEPEPYVDGDHLINVAGKMVVLQKLVDKIHSRGEKMLIFCQMTSMLNIIEDYLCHRHISYVRIDGSTELRERANNMKRFSKEDSGITVFLLSTRAGSLGLNLTAANHVVVYQQDFNPQVDLQAVARAYRILQKKQVYVYRLVSENSVDVRIYERACIKLRLDELIMQNGDFSGQLKKVEQKKAKNALMDLIAFGSDQLFNDMEQDKEDTKFDYNTPEVAFSDEKLDQLLEAAFADQKHLDEEVEERQKHAEEVIKNLSAEGKLEAQDIQNIYQFEGEDFKNITERILEEKRKQWAYRRVAAEEDDDYDTTIEQRDCPTHLKFRRNIYYRPTYYLLDEQFYQLQDKILTHIKEVIQPVFEADLSLTYAQYLERVRAGPDAAIYANEIFPGLTEQEVVVYKKYLEQNCPMMQGQVFTRKEFQLLINSLAECQFEEREIEHGIRRVIYAYEFEDYAKMLEDFTVDPEQQRQYSWGILPPSQNYRIAPPQTFQPIEEPDFKVSYRLFAKQSAMHVTEQQFENYCRTLLSLGAQEDWAIKVQKAVQRRNMLAQRYQLLTQIVESAAKEGNPLLTIQLPSLQRGKGFSELADRFLLVWASIFGLRHWAQCVAFARGFGPLKTDFWLRSRDSTELKERVDKLVKLFEKKDKPGDADAKE